MGEEFLGGVCGGKRWNPPQNMFSGGGWSSLCSVAQLGGGGGGGGGDGSDISGFSWPNEVVKGKPNNINNIEKNHSSFYDESSIIFPADMDSTFDTFFGFNSTSSDCHQINLLGGKDGGNDGNFGSILQDDMNSGLCYGMSSNNFSSNNNNNNSCSQGGSPPMALTPTSNNSSSGDSSAITGEGGGGGGGCLNTTNFDPITSSASYLIQTLFDDTDDSQLIKPNYNNNNNANNGAMNINSNDQLFSWAPITLQLHQDNVNQLVDGGMNVLINGGQGSNGGYANGDIALSSNIQASLLNSFNLHSRSRAPSSNQHRSHPSCANHDAKVNSVQGRDSKGNVKEQTPAKRARIETPSPMPTFKVRKEKLGDRITALQQLVSPFGKTDTASVLHEAIEYIKFLHDQVNALCTPYLKNGAAIQQQQGCEKSNNEEAKQDLRSRGLCLVPISSTYPVAQETPVDFWTPTFGGTTYR